MKKYNLFLDDIRSPEDTFAYTHNQIYLLNWTIVRSYDEFVKCIIYNGIPDVLSMDHDLGSAHYSYQSNIPYDQFEEKTGYHFAKWLINYCIDNNKKLPTTILVHSMNPVGSQNIKSLFNSYYKYHL